MKWSPAVVVQSPGEARDLPSIGEPRKDTWSVHQVVDSTVYERETEGYGYVILYTDERTRKGILWVDRREYEILCSCEKEQGNGISGNGISAEDIARHIPMSKWPKPKVVDRE